MENIYIHLPKSLRVETRDYESRENRAYQCISYMMPEFCRTDQVNTAINKEVVCKILRMFSAGFFAD